MYNKLILTLCCLFIIAPFLLFSESPATRIKWYTNYDEAANQAKTSSKPLVLFFTGSDWCTWCSKIEEEVLNTREFNEGAGNRFIFVKLDFPLYTNQDPQQKAQNKQLQQKYNVRSYPTLLVIDPKNNQQIGTTGYRPGGGKAFSDYLLKMVNDYSSYQQKMGALENENYSGSQLKQLYEQAIKLQLANDASKIADRGIVSNESLFFLTEKYRLLANDGLIHTEEAKDLKKRALDTDSANKNHAAYTIALIDFETYSDQMEKEHYSPEFVIAPLNDYISKFGNVDKDNLWRLKIIISQVYLDNNQMNQALQYAQESYESAPNSAKPEISLAIKNISSQIHSVN